MGVPNNECTYKKSVEENQPLFEVPLLVVEQRGHHLYEHDEEHAPERHPVEHHEHLLESGEDFPQKHAQRGEGGEEEAEQELGGLREGGGVDREAEAEGLQDLVHHQGDVVGLQLVGGPRLHHEALEEGVEGDCQHEDDRLGFAGGVPEAGRVAEAEHVLGLLVVHLEVVVLVEALVVLLDAVLLLPADLLRVAVGMVQQQVVEPYEADEADARGEQGPVGHRVVPGVGGVAALLRDVRDEVHQDYRQNQRRRKRADILENILEFLFRRHEERQITKE